MKLDHLWIIHIRTAASLSRFFFFFWPINHTHTLGLYKSLTRAQTNELDWGGVAALGQCLAVFSLVFRTQCSFFFFFLFMSPHGTTPAYPLCGCFPERRRSAEALILNDDDRQSDVSCRDALWGPAYGPRHWWVPSRCWCALWPPRLRCSTAQLSGWHCVVRRMRRIFPCAVKFVLDMNKWTSR